MMIGDDAANLEGDANDTADEWGESEIRSVIRQAQREHLSPEKVLEKRSHERHSVGAGEQAAAPKPKSRPVVIERKRGGVVGFFRRLFGGK